MAKRQMLAAKNIHKGRVLKELRLIKKVTPISIPPARK